MEKNKYTLYSIILLLIVFVPCAIYGTYMHVKKNANLNHEFKFNNKLYFYESDALLGTYECKSSNCDYAAFSDTSLKSTILNSKYTFIADNENIYLYDITYGKILATYDEIQNIISSIFKVRQSDVWGVISVGNTVSSILDCKFNTVEYKDSKFIVSKDNMWSIYQGQNELFNNELKIKDFNEEFVIVADEKKDKLYDFNKIEYLNTINDKTLSFVENFILLKKDNNYYIYQINNVDGNIMPAIIGNFYYTGEAEITHNLNESAIEFYAGEELLKSIVYSAQEND